MNVQKMNVQKAAYWLALGAFALALHSGYRQGNFSFFNRIQARTSSEFCRIAARAEQTLAMARLLTTGVPNAELADDFTARRQAEAEPPHALIQAEAHRAMALHQVEVNLETNQRQAEVNRAMALRQVDLDRMQQKIQGIRIVMENARFENLRGLERVNVNLSNALSASDHHMLVVCRHTNAQVVVNADSDVADHDSADHDFVDSEVE